MYPTRSKQRQRTRLIVTYSIMVGTVLLLTSILLFALIGYRYNSSQGRFEKGGLVQFVTKPAGAKVTVGSAVLTGTTRTKITLYPGSYLTTMRLEGYTTWQKNITVKSGQVLWLSYARLIPTSPLTEAVLSVPKLDSTAVDADGKYYALITDASQPLVRLVRIDDTANPVSDVAVPASIFHSGKKHIFTLERWSKNEKYLLIKHTYGSGTEWIVLNAADPMKSQAVSAIARLAPTNAMFDPRSEDRLFVTYSDHSLRSKNLTNGEVSDALVKNVARFSFEDNNVFYTSVPVKNTVDVGYYSLESKSPRVVATYRTRDPVKVAASLYFNEVYLAVCVGKNVSIYNLGQLARSDTSITKLESKTDMIKLSTAPLSLESHGKGRFLTMQHGTSLTVYDEELHIVSTTNIQGARQALSQGVMWLDDFHYWQDANGFLRQYEFDGANQTDIVQVTKGFSAAYSNDGLYIYSVAKSGKVYQLQRTKLVAD